jgi:hypothetical protein
MAENMHEAPQENIEMAKLGRELLEEYMADELSGKEKTGHFLKGGDDSKRELDKDFILDELEPEDFIIVNKVLVGIVPEEYWSYAKRREKEGNKSQQTLLAMLNNKVGIIRNKTLILPKNRV